MEYKGDKRIGEVNYNKEGLKMTIVEYNNANNIVVKFEDDTLCKTRYCHFKSGSTRHPSYKNRKGEIGYNTFGSKMVIIEYRHSEDIDIYFEEYNWTFYHSKYTRFKDGNIKCPYEKRYYHQGFLGEGEYKPYINHKPTRAYVHWYQMLRRCFSVKYQDKKPTYIGCQVCDEWLNFQNFAQWYEENYYEVNEEEMHLDKDILVKGNKIYSPNTCIFAPKKINDLFMNKEFHIHHGNYIKVTKEYIQQIAEQYKNVIPHKLYQAMYNYEK